MRHLVRFLVRGLLIGLVACAVASCAGMSGDDARWPVVGEAGSSSHDTLSGINAIRLRVARSALKNGDFDTAIRFFNSINADAPGHLSPLMGLGEAYLAKKDYEEAESAFLDAVKRFPDKPGTYEGLGRVLVAKGDFKGAIQAFNRTLARAPSGSIHNKLGVAHDLMGDGEGAQKHYRAALLLDPDIISARNNLALSLAISEKYDAAIAEMEKVAAEPTATDRHRQNLAFVYGMAGRFDAAARILGKQGFSPDEMTRNETLFERIRSLAKAGDRNAVLAYLSGSKEIGYAEGTSGVSKMASLSANSAKTAPETANSAKAAPETSDSAKTTPETARMAPSAGAVRATKPVPKPKSKPRATAAEPKVASLSPEEPPSAAAPSADPAQEAEGGAYRIQLASYRSEKRAFRGKELLEKLLGDKAAGLEVLVKGNRNDDSMGIDYRLRTGALSSREDGVRQCAEIRAAGYGDCLVIRHNSHLWANVTPPAAKSMVADAERPYRIQLASYRSEKGAVRGQEILSNILGRRVVEQFEVMVRRNRRDDRRGFDYRIRSKPQMTLQEAQNICEAIHRTGYIGCLIIRHNDNLWQTAAGAADKRADASPRYRVQLAAYRQPGGAAEAKKRLAHLIENRGENIKLMVKKTVINKLNKTFYRIRTPAFQNQAEARRLCADMRAAGHKGCWIVKV